MGSSWRRRDTGITIRIIICLSILALLYIVFITVLAYFGLGFFPIVLISAVFILAQWFFSDRLVLWSTGAKIVTK
jgi:heat shock protein HtpX